MKEGLKGNILLMFYIHGDIAKLSCVPFVDLARFVLRTIIVFDLS